MHDGRKITSPEVNFWKKVNKTPTCWLWTGGTQKGYGRFPIHNRTTGKYICKPTHRFAWELLRGPIPKDKQLDHLCRVRNCVNPDHLELVTTKENVLRGIGPTAMNNRKTHCKHGHPFVAENTWFTKNGYRICMTCSKELQRAQRAQKRALLAG